MLGAIAGDIAGSIYENFRTKRKDMRLFGPLSIFTDDTVLTVAVADALLSDRNYERAIRSYAHRHPLRGYGPRFLKWMVTPNAKPYNSFGNGSAMRVSPVGFACDSADEVLHEARRSAECTHNHPEGIKGAQATALAVYLARTGADKATIRTEITGRFGYDLSQTIDEIRPDYKFDMTCQGSVPQAIIALLDSTSFEDALRNAISLGGDADTQAAIAGGIAEAHYKQLPETILHQVRKRLPRTFWKTIIQFYQRFADEPTLRQIEALGT